METNEGRVYFALDGDDFNPDEVTEFLGLKPTNIRRKGSRVSGKIPKFNSWEISTEQVINECVDIYELSTKLIEVLKPKLDLILQVKERFDAESRFQVVLTFSANEEHSAPAIGFEVETIEFLGTVGASIDIDTYKH